jgi:chloride channel 3/4/5
MISVMAAKWIGDAFGIGGIYSVWIAMRGYPWLPSVDFKDKGETGAQIMKPTQNLRVIEDGQFKTSELGQMKSYPSKLKLKC